MEPQNETDTTATRPHPGAPKPGAYLPENDDKKSPTPTPAAVSQATRVAQSKGRAPKIIDAQMTLAEHAFSQWHAKCEPGVTLEQVLRPEYWAHVASKLRPLALIHVNAMDGSFYALLQVRSASRIEAVCEVIVSKEFGPVTRLAQSEEKAFITRYGSPAVGWQVLRAADKQMVKEGFIDEGEAQRWLDGHLKALAA